MNSQLFDEKYFRLNDEEPVHLLKKLIEVFGVDEFNAKRAFICAMEVLPLDTLSQRRAVMLKVRKEYSFAKEVAGGFRTAPNGDEYYFSVLAIGLGKIEEYEQIMFFFSSGKNSRNVLLLTGDRESLGENVLDGLANVFMPSMNTYFPENRLNEILMKLAGYADISLVFGFGGVDIYPAQFLRVIRRI